MDIKKLRLEQERLAKKVVLSENNNSYNIIAGADQAYLDNDTIIGVIVVVDAKSQEIIDKKYSVMKCGMQYIPGFLSYRESAVFIDAYSNLTNDFDLMLVEGNGILHPRRFGIASHIGISINRPTIGVAKSLLCGKEDGTSVYMGKEVLGKIFKPFDHTKPLYISPGHMITLQKSYEIVKKLTQKPYKLPFPLAMANKYAKKVKKRLQEGKEESKEI